MEIKKVSIVIFLICLTLTGCMQTEDDQKRTNVLDAEKSLMSVTSNAVPELIKRLHSKIIIRDGVLIILQKFSLSDVIAFPTTPTWIVNCGVLGLDISFESFGSYNNIAAVNLTKANLTNDQCMDMLPAVVSETKKTLTAYNASQRSLR